LKVNFANDNLIDTMAKFGIHKVENQCMLMKSWMVGQEKAKRNGRGKMKTYSFE